MYKEVIDEIVGAFKEAKAPSLSKVKKVLDNKYDLTGCGIFEISVVRWYEKVDADSSFAAGLYIFDFREY